GRHGVEDLRLPGATVMLPSGTYQGSWCGERECGVGRERAGFRRPEACSERIACRDRHAKASSSDSGLVLHANVLTLLIVKMVHSGRSDDRASDGLRAVLQRCARALDRDLTTNAAP